MGTDGVRTIGTGTRGREARLCRRAAMMMANATNVNGPIVNMKIKTAAQVGNVSVMMVCSTRKRRAAGPSLPKWQVFASLPIEGNDCKGYSIDQRRSVSNCREERAN